MVDNIKLSYKEPLIMNTDISSGPGIHWIVLYPVDKVCYIFYPLGENNFRPYDKIMIEKLNDYDLKINSILEEFNLRIVIYVVILAS